ncbi:YaaA family protein [uncultured Sphingomonas sp.]|uniref:YaaA family protein n=1 Tax=uncultured Sphingomonas sp. TaxID=158754 RepID=UPI0035C99686
MIAVLSPAKTLDYATPLPPIEATHPRFGEEARTLAAAAGRLGAKRLGDLMGISPKLATLNVQRFRGFAEAEERPALYAFAGDVYRGLEAKTLEPEGVAFAQDHLRLLSGLYGLLRPLDAIRPYRLEMGTRWAPRRKALTDWWGDRIAAALADDLAEEGSGVVLNLASQEYWAAIGDRLAENVRVVAVDFRQARPDGPKFESFAAKRARGTMSRWMAEHRIEEIEAMKGFDADGYRFAELVDGDADHWRFVRG